MLLEGVLLLGGGVAWGGEGGGVLLQAPGVLTWTVGYLGFQFFSLFFTLLWLTNLEQGLGGGGESSRGG